MSVPLISRIAKADAQCTFSRLMLRWAISESEHFFCDIDEVVKEREKDIRILKPEDQLEFCKYKGKTIQEVYSIDQNYLMWLNENSEDFVIDVSELNS